uniref:Uncharacterized protein n=1 Tax=Trieres chinensis TaxID=1514140 RepID=A0A7S2A4W8_TRICV|mmetsp:Transcript_40025/g.81732  ORF Transcript_40025/g.81732 Transcript_40025/m.81732 type:complete len:145 (+) Transcript_40025:91-525(+)|eukprot:CAMPEP_0183309038 /NCGR_PEP_ID=MMETSP0160_2-20130417/23648_1 /TAXON_ID=2839 ORGANISM="Odontella Sinensis, Strain Grunow 1884" /NCGR_SAMPLE_ID=MMETSP0160_2 /ASSEMBLY_ACC=CAM_ASM_000250 /LENGTH=144 /DNA_ID=CAMNT_0025472977 /DNA_START=63 /DNA_END=497 /DNA_ORIENTATION=-
MKLSTLSLLLAFGFGSTSAWVPSVKVLKEFAAAAGIAGAITFAPLASNAVDGSVFNHQYSDPKHPNCKRAVVVKNDVDAFISGTDGTPGCPEDGSGNVWRLTGTVEDNTILVDFSPKGGPANLKGVWDGSGIKWPDGNKWSVKN